MRTSARRLEQQDPEVGQSQYPEPRATHILLLRPEVASREEAAAAALGLVDDAVDRYLLSHGPHASANATIYDGLGIASVVADEEEVALLSASPLVEAIFPNEERALPTPVAEEGTDLEALDREMEIDAAGQQSAGALQLKGGSTDLVPAAKSLTWNLRRIGIEPDYELTGAGIGIAVLDTGIDPTHPDFADRPLAPEAVASFVRGESAFDGHGHGTLCAGIIAGPRNSRLGVRYGVAPGARLIVGKVLSDRGRGYDDDIIRGIGWAVAQQGARVVSLSLGSPRGLNSPANELYERVAQRLLELSPGALLVAAAGNDSERPHKLAAVGNPAACQSIVSVGAIDHELAIARFSPRQLDSIGSIRLVAPGVGIQSSVPGGFARRSGTSMAAPHVAGVAALWFEEVVGITALAVKERLIAEAQRLGDSLDFGAGLVRVPRASNATTR